MYKIDLGGRNRPTCMGLIATAVALVVPVACLCEEDIRAQVLDDTAEIRIAGEPLTVEVATSREQLDRGLRYRSCGEPAMLLMLDTPGELPVWQCEVPIALDMLFIRDGQVVEAVVGAPPCPAPCNSCPTYGDGIEVDAVLEVAASRLAPEQVQVGVAVTGF